MIEVKLQSLDIWSCQKLKKCLSIERPNVGKLNSANQKKYSSTSKKSWNLQESK